MPQKYKSCKFLFSASEAWQNLLSTQVSTYSFLLLIGIFPLIKLRSPFCVPSNQPFLQQCSFHLFLFLLLLQLHQPHREHHADRDLHLRRRLLQRGRQVRRRRHLRQRGSEFGGDGKGSLTLGDSGVENSKELPDNLNESKIVFLSN